MANPSISQALSAFAMADFCDLDCGKFDLRIKQAAMHNEEFKAAVARRVMVAKRKSLVPEKGTLTGNFQQDVDLFLDAVVMGWGEKPLKDDDGKVVKYTRDVGQWMFTGSQEGKVLFGKVMQAAAADDMFLLSEDDRGNC